MPISIVLPHVLTPYAQGNATIVVAEQCDTVAEALAAVGARYPALTDRVLTEQGDVRLHVNVFVGDESIRFMDGLQTPVTDGEAITIVAAVSGG